MFRRRDNAFQKRNVKVQVPVITRLENGPFDNLLQALQVDQKAGLFIRLPRDYDIEPVVVAMPVRMATLPEYPPVPLFGSIRIVESVSRIEMSSSGYKDHHYSDLLFFVSLSSSADVRSPLEPLIPSATGLRSSFSTLLESDAVWVSEITSASSASSFLDDSP